MLTKRNYITIPELEEYANITVTDNDEAYDNIARAEEAIDHFVGATQRFLPGVRQGEVTSVSDKTIVDNGPGTQLFMIDGYFARTLIEIIGGTGAGQIRMITASSQNGRSVTVDTAFSPQVDTTSVFKIYQLAKFPRTQDTTANRAGTAYYKTIPDAVKRAVVAQMEFIIQMGDSYFSTDQSDKQSETIGNYSYSKGSGSSGSGGASAAVRMVAPQARALLGGLVNRTGRLIRDNPTNL